MAEYLKKLQYVSRFPKTVKLVTVALLTILTLTRELKNLPSELHWFCSTYTPSAPGLSRVKTEHPIGESVDLRREQACECLMLFSFEGDDARRIQKELGARIDEQLGRCDACVIAYYKSRQRLIHNLRQ